MLAYGMWLELLRGDLSGAEECYRVAIEHGRQKKHWITRAPYGQSSREWFEAKDRVWVQARALTRLARLLHTVHNNSEAAEAALGEAHRVDAMYADAYLVHGKMLAGKGPEWCGQAEEKLRAAIAVNKSHTGALFEYAKVLHHLKNQPYEAERMYRRCLKEDPHHADALGEYAHLLDKPLSDKHAALSMCKRALALDEPRVKILSLYSRLVLDVQGDHAEAEKVLRRVLERDLNCVDALHYYGRLLEHVHRDLAGAERMYRRALLVNADHVPTLTNLAHVVESLYGDVDGADVLYQRALLADPSARDALIGRAKLFQFSRGDIDGAESFYQRLLSVEPLDRDALHLCGNLLYSHRNSATEAERMLKKALFVNNSNVDCLCDYSRLLQDAGRNLEAENQYLRALQVDPGSERAMSCYAMLLHDHLHSYDKAEELYKTILQGSPSSEAKAAVLCGYARLLQHVRHDYDGAQALYRQATHYGVLDAAAMRSYAALLFDVRAQPDDALALHRKLLLSNPAEASTEVLGLARSYVAGGQTKYAEGLYRLLLDTHDCTAMRPHAAWELADLLTARRDFGDATQLYVQGFNEGCGSIDGLMLVARKLQEAGGEVDGEEVLGGGLEKEEASGAVECLRCAYELYSLILERDATNTECSLRLAFVTYRLLLEKDFAAQAANDTAAASASSNGLLKYAACSASTDGRSRCGDGDGGGWKKQRDVEGLWGHVVASLLRTLEHAGGSHAIFERVFALGMRMERGGLIGDAATVLSLGELCFVSLRKE
jgi:tetratricopeptide (TPR) repeat protein